MLECPKCGYDNELGRIFCTQCGTKLDLTKIKAPTEGARMRRRAVKGAKRLTRILLELAIAVALIAGLVLMCLVPDIPPVKPTNAEMIAADTKRLDLDQLVNGRRPGALTITAAEFNAFVNTLSFEKPKESFMQFLPVTIRSEFDEGTVKISYVGDLKLKDFFHKHLSVTLAGTPAVDNGRFVFRAKAAWIGKMPVHPWLVENTGLFHTYFGRLFGKLRYEREMLDRLHSINVSPDGAELVFQPDASR